MRKLFIFLLVLGSWAWAADLAYAPLVTTVEEDEETAFESEYLEEAATNDSDVVDLRDKDVDAPTWSPSFEEEPEEDPGGPLEEW